MRRFFLVVFGLLFVANFGCWFTLDSLLTRLAAPEIMRRLVIGFIALQVAGLVMVIGSRFLGYQPGTGLGRPLLSLVTIWNMLIALPTAVLGGLALAIWWIGSAGLVAPEPPSAGREFGLALVALPMVVAIFGTAVSLWQLNRFRVRRMTLAIPNLPAALKGLTIAHLSDLHVGKLTRGKVLDDMVAATNRLHPDLILLTGDLINFSLQDLPRGIELLRRMQARYGLHSCEGNHDLIESAAEFEAAARASGVSFLLDEGVTISVDGQPVQILGLRWGEGMGPVSEASGRGKALDWLLAQGEPGAFTILLAHHPHVFDAAAAAGIPLTLAGHTHGGQLMFTPGMGFGPWLYRYWSGLYRRGASQLVVSNGAGNWFPLRIGAPAEIIFLTLEPA